MRTEKVLVAINEQGQILDSVLAERYDEVKDLWSRKYRRIYIICIQLPSELSERFVEQVQSIEYMECYQPAKDHGISDYKNCRSAIKI